MRVRHLVGCVVVGVLCVAAAAVAADAVPDAVYPGPNWAIVIVSVLAALGVLDRLARWGFKYRRLLMILCDVIERLSRQGSSDTETLKGIMREITSKLPREDREIMTKSVGSAEKKSDRNGTATRTLQDESKAVKVARFLGRFLPVVGRFI